MKHFEVIFMNVKERFTFHCMIKEAVKLFKFLPQSNSLTGISKQQWREIKFSLTGRRGCINLCIILGGYGDGKYEDPYRKGKIVLAKISCDFSLSTCHTVTFEIPL
jgi:hypothetical protein